MIGGLIPFLLALFGASGLDLVDFNTQLGKVDKSFQKLAQAEVEREVLGKGIPGVTVAIVLNGGLVAAFGEGVRKEGFDDPIRVDDPMHIGSNTKGMTALAFARLVEKRKISFDDTLGATFGEVAPNMCAAFKEVPLIKLMHHRSGIVQTDPENWHAQTDPTGPRLAMVRYALTQEPPTPPGTKFEYRNGNFILVGAAMELATGQSWETIMENEVFGPLHMKEAGFGPMGDGLSVDTPWQHKVTNGVPVPIYHDNPSMMGPAGTVHCSALDLANYAYAQVQGDYDAKWYLSPKTWKTLHTPFTGGQYACGIFSLGPGPQGCHDMSHRGSNTLSCSDWKTGYDGRVVVVVMMNVSNDEVIGKLSQNLMDLTAQYGGLK